MNKKGFTLVELLGVIVIIGVIMTLAVPGFFIISNSIKDSMLKSKIKLIEENATLYGEDNKDDIINSNLLYNNYQCKSILVSTLVLEDYLEKDNDNECLKINEIGSGCIVNPKDKDKYLDNYEVIIYYKDNNIHAKLNFDDNIDCS